MRLYTPRQVAVATFLGSVPAGFWLIARNFLALGKQAQARTTMVLGGLVTIGYIAFSISVAFAPDAPGASTSIIPIVSIVVMHWLAEKLHRHEVEQLRERKQPLGSNWLVLASGVGGLVVTLGVLVGLVYAFGLSDRIEL